MRITAQETNHLTLITKILIFEIMDLKRVEIELKKRWAYPYHWGRKQSDDWDRITHFIYTTYSFKSLLERTDTFDNDLRDYALNRWYNFWSAMACEYIFATHHIVTPNRDRYDKLVDFSIQNIPFDHKTSVFPKGFKQTIGYAKQHKLELIRWFYTNQSQQGRRHLANRLFVVLFDHQSNDHWKLKAEINLLRQAIDTYMNGFSIPNLITLNIENRQVLSDVIWVERC